MRRVLALHRVRRPEDLRLKRLEVLLKHLHDRGIKKVVLRRDPVCAQRRDRPTEPRREHVFVATVYVVRETVGAADQERPLDGVVSKDDVRQGVVALALVGGVRALHVDHPSKEKRFFVRSSPTRTSLRKEIINTYSKLLGSLSYDPSEHSSPTSHYTSTISLLTTARVASTRSAV